METSRVSVVQLKLLIFGLHLCVASLSFSPCDAARRLMQPVMRGGSRPHPRPAAGSSILTNPTKNKILLQVSKHLGIFSLDDSNTEPYGVSSPFSLPPYDSLAPIPLPDQNVPPFCIYPPFTPQPPPPSTTVPVIPPPTGPGGGGGGGGGYTPSLPPPSSSSTPTLPNQSPPPPPSPAGGGGGGGGVPSPPESIPSPIPNIPPEIVPSPPQSIVPSPPTFVPSPTQPVPSPPYSYEPSPPSYVVPSPPSVFVPSPPSYYQPISPPGTVVPGPPSIFVPSPPVFQPPVVYPPPAVPPPPKKAPYSALWCVAKPTVPDPIIKEAMNYACGSGADCDSIQPSGSCFQPDTLFAHASYAFNSYWQRTKVAGGTCDFGGTGMLVTVDPSYDGCHFAYY